MGNVDAIVAEQMMALPFGLLPLEDRGLTDADLAALLDHPQVPPLKQVRLHGNQLGAPSAGRLVAHAKMARLQRLGLSRNPLGDAGLQQLAAGPHASSLRELEIAAVGAGGAAVATVMAAMPRLMKVDAGDQAAGDAAAMAVGDLGALVEVHLCRAHVTASGAAAVLSSRAQTVGLGGNPLGAGALAGLTRLGANLRALDLRETGLAAQDAVALARVSAPALIRLELSGCPLGSDGVAAMAGSSLLQQLEVLALEGCGGGPAVAAVQTAWGDRPGLSIG